MIHILILANLKNCHGQYSDNQISRCSKIGGSLGKGVEEVFSHTIMDKYGHISKTCDFSDKKNVQKFILLYKNEHLFQKNNTVRFHKGFEEVTNIIHVKEPQKLQCRFTKYSIGLDKEKYVCGY